MGWLYQLTYGQLVTQSKGVFLAGTFGVMMTTSLLVGFLLNSFCREASGSGIPQLKLAFWKEFGLVSWRVVWVKFVAGILSVGGGCSLGREGPSVQLAGGLASNLAGIMGEPKQNRRTAAASGAAAGLAAAFNRRRFVGVRHRRVRRAWVDWETAGVHSALSAFNFLGDLRGDAVRGSRGDSGWRVVPEIHFEIAGAAQEFQKSSRLVSTGHRRVHYVGIGFAGFPEDRQYGRIQPRLR